MDQQKRLMLALFLTLGILMAWSVLFPPPKPPAQDQPEFAQTTERQPTTISNSPAVRVSTPDVAESFSIQPFSMKVGSNRAGIQTLKINGAKLFSDSIPGLLEIELIGPTVNELLFKTRQNGLNLTSVSKETEAGFVVTRTISMDSSKSPYIWNLMVRLENRSQEPKSGQLRMVAYRPAYAKEKIDERYLQGAAFIEGKQQVLKLRKGETKHYANPPEWVSSQGKSHLFVLKQDTNRITFHMKRFSAPLQSVVGFMDFPEVALVPGQGRVWRFDIYAGPLDMEAMSKIGFGEVVSFGILSGIVEILVRFLNWGHKLFNNYGMAICLLSFMVWLPFAPFTWFGMRQQTLMMEKMARFKPQEARLRAEHAKNPQKMQQELMQLYKREKINPLSGCMGCLPLLATMPVYIALFQLLNRAPQLRGASFLWIKDLSAPDALIPFPGTIPIIGDSFNILPILAVIAMFFQQKLMQKPQEATMTDEQKMQQKIFKFFPLMLLVFFYRLPAGFMLYWVVNSSLMAGQQIALARLKKR